MYKLKVVLLMITALVGCDSETKNADQYWYIPYFDAYLKIDAENNVKWLRCSLNSGYLLDEDIRITLSDRKMEFTVNARTETANFIVSGDQATLEFPEDYDPSLERVNRPREYCESNSIHITSVTPSTAIEGIRTEFSVAFDYRLQSEWPAEISLGFTNPEIDFTYDEVIFTIDESGISSGTLVARITPKDYEDSDFKIRLIMRPQGADTYYRLIPSGSASQNIILNKGDESLNRECLTCIVANPYP